ncbi:hypothetical protein LIPSTDRAFT_192181 [Lipomyces starkeyi NRRL Y-11557]|uniref:Uncharacterized protein n=1 Tax=Lipomyces starkeyi NRRL Y-11557 TaxID=675824 RepID=A0A1E3PW40_LIPST|nr:hypothetical protein LIPSTDRAFT_192181 [Lipomyces starkeyi NRRL Y-11557]
MTFCLRSLSRHYSSLVVSATPRLRALAILLFLTKRLAYLVTTPIYSAFLKGYFIVVKSHCRVSDCITKSTRFYKHLARIKEEVCSGHQTSMNLIKAHIKFKIRNLNCGSSLRPARASDLPLRIDHVARG